MYSRDEEDIRDELKYLADKKEYGWTQKDLDRYDYLNEILERDENRKQ